jgi:dTDP-4-dehydrorhamnose 3,5-epimerase
VSSRFLAAGVLPKGVSVHLLDERHDNRGSFTEFFRTSWNSGIDPVQWSLVKSVAGTLRGMHLHWRHDEFFFLASGRSCVGLRDVRPESATRDTSCLLEFTQDDPAILTFPRGILHGWYFHEDSVHIQAVSDEEYARYHVDDNQGCHWSDPAIGIPWPCKPTHVSERADGFPDLATLLRLAP